MDDVAAMLDVAEACRAMYGNEETDKFRFRATVSLGQVDVEVPVLHSSDGTFR
eukprot:COSAG02_NODE_11444_length_1723_cov_1.104064_2_plen_52_part_01